MKVRNLMLSTALAAILVPVGPLPAAEHVVPTEELRQELQKSSTARDENLARLQSVFEAEHAEKALRSVGLDVKEISSAATSLDDETLASLAQRAQQFQTDVTAGALNNQQITYILIALATAVVILVIVAA